MLPFAADSFAIREVGDISGEKVQLKMFLLGQKSIRSCEAILALNQQAFQTSMRTVYGSKKASRIDIVSYFLFSYSLTLKPELLF